MQIRYKRKLTRRTRLPYSSAETALGITFKLVDEYRQTIQPFVDKVLQRVYDTIGIPAHMISNGQTEWKFHL